MNLVKIKVDTTSNKTADVTGMIIRKNNQYRIVYFPKLVDNSKNSEECVAGYLVCQKKSKNDQWGYKKYKYYWNKKTYYKINWRQI